MSWNVCFLCLSVYRFCNDWVTAKISECLQITVGGVLLVLFWLGLFWRLPLFRGANRNHEITSNVGSGSNLTAVSDNLLLVVFQHYLLCSFFLGRSVIRRFFGNDLKWFLLIMSNFIQCLLKIICLLFFKFIFLPNLIKTFAFNIWYKFGTYEKRSREKFGQPRKANSVFFWQIWIHG